MLGNFYLDCSYRHQQNLRPELIRFKDYVLKIQSNFIKPRPRSRYLVGFEPRICSLQHHDHNYNNNISLPSVSLSVMQFLFDTTSV